MLRLRPLRLATTVSKLKRHSDTFALSLRRIFLYPSAWLHRRLSPNVMVIGITGSAGKTTTKDLCAGVLASFAPCASTFKTENYRASVAETLLSIRRKHRYCVLELSGGKPGVMDLPISLARPDIGVLTVIGRDHFRAFKGLQGIAEEKAKLVARLPRNGVAVLNIDDPKVKAIGEQYTGRCIWVGRDVEADVQLLDVQSCWPKPLTLTIKYKQICYDVPTNLHGEHLALSVLCALGVTIALGLPLEQSVAAIRTQEPTEGRMQVVANDDGVVFIRDDWKAPYWSLHAPLKFLRDANAQRKVAVIGTLSDYSADASAQYKRAAREVREHADLAIFVGPHAHRALRARRDESDDTIQGFSSIRAAADYLQSNLEPGDLVLLKGSNKADHLVRLLLNRYQSIQCWAERCGLHTFCDHCPQLHKPVVEAPAEAFIRDTLPLQPNFNQSSHAKVPVVVGLGNPGGEYENTPHNIGYRVLDTLAEMSGSDWQRSDEGFVCTIKLDHRQEAKLFKPLAKINLTGPVVREFLLKQGGDPAHCLIIHDDMDLKLGASRLKRDGGDGGHRGVRSIVEALGTDAVHRIRVGVRRPGDAARAKARVLEPFSPEEAEVLNQHVKQTVIEVRKQLLNLYYPDRVILNHLPAIEQHRDD